MTIPRRPTSRPNMHVNVRRLSQTAAFFSNCLSSTTSKTLTNGKNGTAMTFRATRQRHSAAHGLTISALRRASMHPIAGSNRRYRTAQAIQQTASRLTGAASIARYGTLNGATWTTLRPLYGRTRTISQSAVIPTSTATICTPTFSLKTRG